MTIVRGMAVPAMLTRHAYGRISGSLVAPSMLAKALAPVAAAALWALGPGYGPVLVALVAGSAVLTLAFVAAALSQGPSAARPEPVHAPDT